jgi:hypothetical protein
MFAFRVIETKWTRVVLNIGRLPQEVEAKRDLMGRNLNDKRSG